MKKREGFSIVEVLIVVIVIVIVAAVGWLAYTNLSSPKSTETSKDSSTKSEQVTVEREADLYKADEALDNVKIEDADSSELDSAIGSF